MNGSEQDGGGAVNGGTGSRGLQGQDPYHPKEEEEEERGSPETNRPEAQPPVHAVPPAPTPLLVNVGSDGRNPNETSSHKEATSATSKVPGEDKTSTAPSRAPENLRDPSGADEKNQTAPPLDGSPVNGQHTRLRRLSEANETVHQYLTLVVHSGGWSVSKGMATVSASLLAVAAAVVLAF
ncbi:Toxoplasma gondii family A protein [Besnoitia besnoiti]|uniref:Toxoplasma gondii family A protein n=1 Tax=Besnoitia besnoiti TaxID=94643 RepID=A0A2A9MDZ8_BESBE|nr:Toxoplasma gondii family A protein [Besnoitia besnoiti]PFH36738.1 Toxoplasma gondii family A protein [Besnoitia besnoiti]